jgi:hypothetical protein
MHERRRSESGDRTDPLIKLIEHWKKRVIALLTLISLGLIAVMVVLLEVSELVGAFQLLRTRHYHAPEQQQEAFHRPERRQSVPARGLESRDVWHGSSQNRRRRNGGASGCGNHRISP